MFPRLWSFTVAEGGRYRYAAGSTSCISDWLPRCPVLCMQPRSTCRQKFASLCYRERLSAGPS